jgi:hypothetical protein
MLGISYPKELTSPLTFINKTEFALKLLKNRLSNLRVPKLSLLHDMNLKNYKMYIHFDSHRNQNQS